MDDHLPKERLGQPKRSDFGMHDWNMPWAFEAIGRLVHGYVNLEQLLANMFGELSGVEWPLSTLLQGDGRPSTFMGTIKRLARAKGYPDEIMRHLETVFAEINYVKEMRDICAHCGVMYINHRTPWMLFSNSFTAPIDKRRSYIVSRNDLYEYSYYMFELTRHLGILRNHKLPEPPTFRGRPALLDILHPRARDRPNGPKQKRPA